MFRYQILIEYVGTNFRGWQVQKKGKTIQGLIQGKISELLNEKIMILSYFVPEGSLRRKSLSLLDI